MSRHKSSADWSALVFPKVLEALGSPLSPKMKILDFGCGSGDLVVHLREAGYQAHGVDLDDSFAESLSQTGPAGDVFRVIESNPYRIPFEDRSFDVVVSDEVFEHVQDYGRALAELRRVLKPGGVALHAFPSGWRLLEGHVYVPLAGVIQNPAYLKLWAWLGVRNEYQKGLPWREVASLNTEYLKTGTNYPSKKEVREHFKAHFEDVRFVERVFWKHGSRRLRSLSRLLLNLPLTDMLFGELRGRAVFCRRTSERQQGEPQAAEVGRLGEARADSNQPVSGGQEENGRRLQQEDRSLQRAARFRPAGDRCDQKQGHEIGSSLPKGYVEDEEQQQKQ